MDLWSGWILQRISSHGDKENKTRIVIYFDKTKQK